jgi:hypothetical protein
MSAHTLGPVNYDPTDPKSTGVAAWLNEASRGIKEGI